MVVLEEENVKSSDLILMNRYVYYRGLNISFLQQAVSYNFFMESPNYGQESDTSLGNICQHWNSTKIPGSLG